MLVLVPHFIYSSNVGLEAGNNTQPCVDASSSVALSVHQVYTTSRRVRGQPEDVRSAVSCEPEQREHGDRPVTPLWSLSQVTINGSRLTVVLAASLTSLPSTHRCEKAVTKVVLSVEVALHVLPLELILATPSAADTVPLIAHALLTPSTRCFPLARAATKVPDYHADAVRVSDEVLQSLQPLHVMGRL